MAKKEFYYAEAERLYTEEQMTINEVACKLNIAVRTVNYWKKDKSWDLKREKFLNSKRTFHERLYDFSHMLMDSIEKDIKNGERLDERRLNTFTKILPLVTKMKDYEETINKMRKPKEDKTSLTEDEVRQIEELLGIKRIPKPQTGG